MSETMIEATSQATVVDQPLVTFGRDICGDLQAGLRREWLVTNGLGGYASGTLAGINTRRYHGLLVAALMPPVGRTVLVGGAVEWAVYDGRRYPLSANEYGDGTVDPHGYRHLESFRLKGALPVWTFAIGDALLERRVWMANGANTTYIRYSLLRGTRPVELEFTPLVTYRDFHALSTGEGWQPAVETHAHGMTIQAFDGAHPFHILADRGTFRPAGYWYYNFRHREERARGLDDRSDLFAPATLIATLGPARPLHSRPKPMKGGEMDLDGTDGDLTIVLTTDARPEMDSSRALATVRARQIELLCRAGVGKAHPAVQQLTLAADQFIVVRGSTGAQGPSGNGATVIAGYHWFNDWGRDTMISLPGLTLSTNRPEDAAGILRTFAQYVRDGLLPNNFPDSAGVVPGYNTVDATLWYVHAIRAYYVATGDRALVDELLPVLCEIVKCHLRGTRYHIGVHPEDGLLFAGEPGVQLTWMDAKIGDWVVTPRTGKPVEINALWYNVLRTLQGFLADRGDSAAAYFAALADRVRQSFRARFIHPEHGYLADVVDGPDGDDWTLRPNQIFAVSLPYPLLDGQEAAAVVEAVGRTLLTSFGLRSLAPDDPAYRGDYDGDSFHRDSGYHQGPVWTWLVGAYAEAYARVYDDPATAVTFLEPFVHHLRDGCLGSVSEILEGDAPHLPRGCVAQAWGVAEVLRVWRQLEQATLG